MRSKSSIPSTEQMEPDGFQIGFVGDAICISGRVCSKTDTQKVISALQALQVMLPDRNPEHEPEQKLLTEE